MLNNAVKTIAKGAGIILIGIIISKLFGFFFRLIAARAGTEQYGLFTLSLAIAGFLIYFSAFGLNQGLLRYGSYYKGKGNLKKIEEIASNIFKINFIISIILAFLLFILSDFISITFFHNINLSPLLKIIAIVIPFDVLRRAMYSLSKVYSKVEYEVYSKNLVENLIKVVLSLILVYLGYKAIGIMVAYVIAIIISFFIILYLVQKHLFTVINHPFKKPHLDKNILKFSLPLVLTELVLLATIWMDTLLLGFFKTASEVGIYNAAVPLAQLLYVFPNMVLALFLPVMSELLAKKNLGVFKSTYRKIAKWIFTFNIMVLALFLIYSKEIITVLFGPNYSSGYLALIILSIGSFIYYYALTSYNVLLSLEKSKLVLTISILALIIGIILNLIFIPAYGVTGAALATSIQFTIGGLMLIFFSTRKIKINPLQLSYIKVLFSLIPSVILVWLFTQYTDFSGIISLLLGGIILSLVYGIMLLVTKSIDQEDKELILSILSKIKTKII